MSKIRESFQWLRHFELTNPKGKWVRFKGKALHPTISGNARKYVDEELQLSARTLVGKPLTVNHNPERIVGNVEWAQYEDGAIEYMAQVDSQKHPEYADKVSDMFNMTEDDYAVKWGRPPIYGVSVEANYLYHDEDCNAGYCTIEPHGIIFSALSLVEDPETPGVEGTTIELMESLHEHSLAEAQMVGVLLHDYHKYHDLPRSIFDGYNRNVVIKLKGEKPLGKTKQRTKKVEEKKLGVVKHTETAVSSTPSYDPRNVLMEQDAPADTGDHDCGPNKHWDEELGKCVADETPAATEQDEHGCDPDKTWDAEQEKCVPKAAEQEEFPTDLPAVPEAPAEPPEPPTIAGDSPVADKDGDEEEFPEEVPAVPEAPAEPPAPPTVDSLRLGEPFADYVDFDDCVRKNQQASDPEAYCASIKRQVEGETKRRQMKEIRRIVREELAVALKGMKRQFEDVGDNIKEIRNDQKRIEQLGFNRESRRKTRETVLRNHTVKLQGYVVDTFKKVYEGMKNTKNLVETVVKKLATHDKYIKAMHSFNEQMAKRMKFYGDYIKTDKPLQERQCKTIGETKQRLNALGSVVKNIVSREQRVDATLSSYHTEIQGLREKVDIGTKAWNNLVLLNKKFEANTADNSKTVKETLETKQNFDKKLTEIEKRLQGEVDTLKKHIKPNFKASPAPPEATEEPVYEPPYS